MTRTKRLVGALLAVALVCTPGTARAQTQQGADPETSPAASDGAVRVTLVTGDRVSVRTLDGERVPQVEPAEGREDIPFSVYRAGDHLYVLPADAVPLLNAGRLDRRLFDVAALLSFGYDDARRWTFP